MLEKFHRKWNSFKWLNEVQRRSAFIMNTNPLFAFNKPNSKLLSSSLKFRRERRKSLKIERAVFSTRRKSCRWKIDDRDCSRTRCRWQWCWPNTRKFVLFFGVKCADLDIHDGKFFLMHPKLDLTLGLFRPRFGGFSHHHSFRIRRKFKDFRKSFKVNLFSSAIKNEVCEEKEFHSNAHQTH